MSVPTVNTRTWREWATIQVNNAKSATFTNSVLGAVATAGAAFAARAAWTKVTTVALGVTVTPTMFTVVAVAFAALGVAFFNFARQAYNDANTPTTPSAPAPQGPAGGAAQQPEVVTATAQANVVTSPEAKKGGLFSRG